MRDFLPRLTPASGHPGAGVFLRLEKKEGEAFAPSPSSPGDTALGFQALPAGALALTALAMPLIAVARRPTTSAGSGSFEVA
jgi:hypothetical protein